MKDNTKKFLYIGGAILLVSGVGYYFWSRSQRLKEEKDANVQPETPAPSVNPATSVVNAILGTSTTVQKPKELDTAEKIKAFQDWLDLRYPLWIKGADGKYKSLNKGTGYGVYGPATQNMWKLKGAEYLLGLNIATTSTSSNVSTSNTGVHSPQDLDLILTYGRGSNSYTENSKNKPAEYIKNWANAIRKRSSTNEQQGTVFNFNNGIYDSYMGELVTDVPYSWVGSLTKRTSTNNAFLRMEPNETSGTNTLVGNVDLGPLKGMKFIDSSRKLYFFVPENMENKLYKWIWSGFVKR